MAAQDSTTPPFDNDSSVRKRVCKACDRCRLKKSKCDGTTPCSRCRSDNAICVFGERKKSLDKVYPKGYVEMLEQQQVQLVDGLHELYKRSIEGKQWQGLALDESANGRPLTHHILDSLGVLQQEKQVNFGAFEDDFETMQQRLLGEGADLILPRQTSFETDGDQESVQEFFFEPSPKRLSLKNPFAASQLPTPPIQSPSTVQSTNQRAPSWPSTQRQVRPQSLQLTPGYRSWDAGLNPMTFQVNNFSDSPIRFEQTEFAFPSHGFSSFPCGNVDTMTPMNVFNNGDNKAEVDFSDFLNPGMQ